MSDQSENTQNPVPHCRSSCLEQFISAKDVRAAPCVPVAMPGPIARSTARSSSAERPEIGGHPERHGGVASAQERTSARTAHIALQRTTTPHHMRFQVQHRWGCRKNTAAIRLCKLLQTMNLTLPIPIPLFWVATVDPVTILRLATSCATVNRNRFHECSD